MTKSTLKLILVAMIGIFIAADSIAQEWNIGNMQMTFTDPSRGNRQINTRIYYPADLAGPNQPLGSPANKPFPVIVFGHDQQISYNHYAYIWNEFATKGFIVVLPKTEMGSSMNVVEFAKDMAFIVDQFVAMDNTPGSFMYQRYMGRSCVMGHGIGGSAATFAVQYSPNITTMVSLAATETTPSAITAASLVTVPSVVVGGGEDCVSPIATHQMPMFDNIDSDCKFFVNLLEATHCHFAQNAGACIWSSTICGGSPCNVVSTNSNTGYLLVSFLRYYLKFNAPALDKFYWKLGSKAQDWSYIMVCNLVNTPRYSDSELASLDEETPVSMNVYPNPVKQGNTLNLVVRSEESMTGKAVVTNLMGQIVATQNLVFDDVITETEISVGNIAKGNYMVTVYTEQGKTTKPLIIQ
jgi:hypothetical protein